MKVDAWAVMGSLLTLVVLPFVRRLIDYILPKGRYFRWVERYSVATRDDDEPDTDTEEDTDDGR